MAKSKPKLLKRINKRVESYLQRRPHRTFRLTRRRDHIRSLELPGYIAFTKHVFNTIWKYRKTFGLLALFYAILTILMVGVASQETYNTLKLTLNATGAGLFTGGFGEIGKAGLLFITSATGGISQNLTDVQQVYAGLITLLTWLTTVWLLRNILAGHKVKLRDGLYNAGSPIVSTFIVAIVFIVQLLPLALALIGYGAASSSGLLNNGIEAMLFWVAAGSLVVLSLYWVTSTFFALVIVTLPGMYPFKALKVAGDMVIGRRLRILYRFIWMFVLVAVSWMVVMIPVILLDSWIKSIWSALNWIPVVPFVMLGLSSVTILYISSYVYLLYRKVVADEAKPA